tara:strand:+ start:44947 stop:45603 length:657 start_codon:yes stop_codon:yes gene_type:complete
MKRKLMKGGRGSTTKFDEAWNIATKPIRNVTITDFDQLKDMYSKNDRYFPKAIENLVKLMNNKQYWEETGSVEGGVCDIANDRVKLELGTTVYSSKEVDGHSAGYKYARKDLVGAFVKNDDGTQVINNINIYKKKWLINGGKTPEGDYKHCPCLKQPEGEKEKLIESIVNNEPYIPSNPLSESSEGGTRRRRKTYKKRKSRKSRRKRKSKKTKRRRRK